MSVENGTWIMRGIPASDPACLHSAADLEALVEQIGFLPLFAGEVPGFSVEERTAPEDWWTGDPGTDPWEWRITLTERRQVVYGKFFGGRAGFVARDWLPVFANYRRDGYDFDARWEDELASYRQKKIMDLFFGDQADAERFSFEVREKAGFGKGGEKNFAGTLTGLEMETYLVCAGFRQRVNKKGASYGWPIAVLATPEHLFGRELVTSCYREEPKTSLEKLEARVKEIVPQAEEREIRALLAYGSDRPGRGSRSLPYPQNLFHVLDKERDPASWTEDQITGLFVALGQLVPKQQRVMQEKYRDGKTYEAIGRELNRTAGTVGTYHHKALVRLRDPLVAAWYRDGYQANLRACAGAEHWTFPLPAAAEQISEADLALRLGLKVRHYEAMARAGICTVGDLVRVSLANPKWYRDLPGIGPKTAQDMQQKLRDFGFLQGSAKKEDDAW